MHKMVTNVVKEKALRDAQLRALKLFSDTIACTYGPMGGFTTYSKHDTAKAGKERPIVSYYTKDGFTVLNNIQVDSPIESLLREEIRDICAQVIKIVGDGTSTAVLLSYQIFKGMLDLLNRGFSKRLIIKCFKELVKEISEKIMSNGRETTLDDIYKIALTSTNGNEDMAALIKKIYDDYGMNVFIDVQGSSGPETIVKGYDGMFYDSGYLESCFINNEADHNCVLNNPAIYTFESPIDTPEMVNLFSAIVKAELTEKAQAIQEYQKKGRNVPAKYMIRDVVIICPFISRDANSYLDWLINSFTQATPENRFHFCIVADMNDDPQKLIDIMKLTGSKFIKKYINPEQYKIDQENGLAPTAETITTFAGSAERVIVDAVSTRIINPKNMRDEDGKLTDFFTNYIDELKNLLSKYEETREEIVKIGKLKRRIHNLMGNMVDLYVGGIGTSDRKSLTDSIEDAVLNCRSAAQDGVGYAASYEGLRAANNINKELKSYATPEATEYEKTKAAVGSVILGAYVAVSSMIYDPYYDDHVESLKTVLLTLSNQDESKRQPFNIITEKYDGTVLTSIKTEPAILDSISRIITILFDTNQYLVPTPQFNIYDVEDEKMIIDNTKTPVVNSSGTIVGTTTD